MRNPCIAACAFASSRLMFGLISMTFNAARMGGRTCLQRALSWLSWAVQLSGVVAGIGSAARSVIAQLWKYHVWEQQMEGAPLVFPKAVPSDGL